MSVILPNRRFGNSAVGEFNNSYLLNVALVVEDSLERWLDGHQRRPDC